MITLSKDKVMINTLAFSIGLTVYVIMGVLMTILGSKYWSRNWKAYSMVPICFLAMLVITTKIGILTSIMYAMASMTITGLPFLVMFS